MNIRKILFAATALTLPTTGFAQDKASDLISPEAADRQIAQAVQSLANRLETTRADGQFLDEAGLKALFADDEDLVITVGNIGTRNGEPVLENVWFGSEEFPESGVKVGRVAVFGLADDFGNASGSLIDSIVFEDVRSVNFSRLSDELVKMEFSVDRVVVEGLERQQTQGSDIADDSLIDSGLMTFAQYLTSTSLDGIIIEGVTIDMAANLPPDGPIQMTMSLDTFALDGWAKGNLQSLIVKGMKAEGRITEPDTYAATGEVITIPFNLGIGSFSVSEVRLSELASNLAIGQYPTYDQTDILSLGRFDSRSFTMGFGEENFFRAEHSQTLLNDFHWLIPTRIETRMEGFSYNLKGFWEFMQLMPDQEFDLSKSGLTRNEVTKLGDDILSVLKKVDLDPLMASEEVLLTWSPENGAIEGSYRSSLKQQTVFKLKFSGSAPTAKALFAEPPGTPLTGRGLENDISLGHLEIRLDDEGLLEHGFIAAVEIAKLLPEKIQTPQSQTLAQSDPTQLRNGVASMVRMAGLAANGEDIPVAAKDYISAFADFMMGGGSYIVAMEPEKPAYITDIEKLKENPSYEDVADLLGLTVRHEPPAK